MICAGIDAGSRTVKAAVVDVSSGVVLATALADQGLQQAQLARAVYEQALARAGVGAGQVRRIVATGYARAAVEEAHTTITEITCHAAGVHHLMPQAVTVVEIGGQDSKLLRLDSGGGVRDFSMNDRCAAGTGRFLEALAARLEVGLNALGELAARGTRPAVISSTCVVFAETEIIGLLAGGTSAADIVAGVQSAMCSRVAAMAGRNLEGPVAFTGGVAMVGGMDAALSAAIGRPVAVCPQPQMTGAIGAALLAGRLADGRWALERPAAAR